jgi:putative membrane protein
MSSDPSRPRVIDLEEREDAAPRPSGPQVIMTERTEPIVPAEPLRRAAPAPPTVRRRSRAVSLGLTGIGVGIAAWFGVDAYWWIEGAFEESALLGGLAALAVTAGVAGAGAIIARELTSLWRLRSVETVRAQLAADVVRPRDAQKIIADILSVIPKERETVFAIEAFQRQVQRHHTVVQQTEILSRTVMKPLDARAEAHIRTAVVRAFGVTAISPTGLTDAAFFLALGVRMVRSIAASYGHRPTMAATVHLLRRLLIEAGKLGAVDIASTTLVQQLGGAVAERLATTAADSFYAAYRMARLGVMVMDLCRPVPFRDEDVPSITSLVGNAIKHRPGDAR